MILGALMPMRVHVWRFRKFAADLSDSRADRSDSVRDNYDVILSRVTASEGDIFL